MPENKGPIPKKKTCSRVSNLVWKLALARQDRKKDDDRDRDRKRSRDREKEKDRSLKRLPRSVRAENVSVRRSNPNLPDPHVP